MGGDLTLAAPVRSWRVAAASVRGAAHARGEAPCQDAHGWSPLPDGGLVAAVADGAGTAALGEVGARTAVDALVELVRRALEEGGGGADPAAALCDAFPAALAAVRDEAQARGVDLSALATTLVAAVATPERTVAAQVGDGAIVVRDAGGSIRSLEVGGRRGEYLNETVFLTSPGALDPLPSMTWEAPASHLALLTDGLQLLALRLPAGTPHPPFFEPLFRFVEQEPDAGRASERLRAYLASPKIGARTEDDVTLLLAALT
ncbi:MAG TPA: PP2C family serine/threonine-protein phosphatase [Longimicrobiaceae bacterium]|nr:PP2C family serine/threonine-protein phosphatase [Longimicrobiaceae bacterium]